MQGVQSLGLGFSDGRDVGGSREAPVTREAAPSVLDDEALGVISIRWLVMQQRTGCVSLRPAFPEPATGKVMRQKRQNTLATAHSLVKVPRLCQGANQIRSRLRQRIVHGPATAQIALSPLSRGLEREQGNYIPHVGVEDLFLGRVGRRSDLMRINIPAQIFDVRQDHIGRFVVEAMVLSTSGRGNVRCQPCEDDYVIRVGVFVHWYSPDYFEAVA